MHFPLSVNDTSQLLPQATPFVFVSRLELLEPDTCTTSFDVHSDCVLLQGDTLSSSALVENMAQSCAAMMGAKGSMMGEKPKLGFIGDVRGLECLRLPKVGDTIFTKIKIDNQIFDVVMVSATVFLREEQIAKCKMKIFVQPNA